jgi:hypothetical protein
MLQMLQLGEQAGWVGLEVNARLQRQHWYWDDRPNPRHWCFVRQQALARQNPLAHPGYSMMN